MLRLKVTMVTSLEMNGAWLGLFVFLFPVLCCCILLLHLVSYLCFLSWCKCSIYLSN